MRWISISVLGFAAMFPLAVEAEAICVEEAAGICLKYETVKPAAAEQPARVVSAAEKAEIALRMTRDERKAVQSRLQQLGHYPGGVDGALGRASRRAIANWQSEQGEEASGFLTLGQFRNLTSPAKEPPKAVANAAPEPTPEPAVEVAPDPVPEPVISAPKVDHPVKGRTYSHVYDLATISVYRVEITREDAANARVWLIVDSGDQGMQDSCVVPLTGAFECYMSARNWSARRVHGTLPEVRIDRASKTPGSNVHRFWEE